ncbi:hypothetical protein DITRI_Ditri17bG0041400 [Diplodiscus trichospermus]
MALTQSSQVKMMVVFLAVVVLISSTVAVPRQDLILKPINLGRKLLDYYAPSKSYPGTPNGGGGNPCCK